MGNRAFCCLDSLVICKVSTLACFPLEPVCVDCAFIDQAVEGFKDGLDFVFLDCIEFPELEISFDESDAVTHHSVSTISDSSKLKLVAIFKSHNICCQD